MHFLHSGWSAFQTKRRREGLKNRAARPQSHWCFLDLSCALAFKDMTFPSLFRRTNTVGVFATVLWLPRAAPLCGRESRYGARARRSAMQ